MVNNLLKPDLSLKIGRLELKNPVITASGTFGYADEFEDHMNLQNIGAIITKGITLNPCQGNPQPRIKEVKNGLINRIGLENLGIHGFIEKKLPILIDKKINYILNVAGFSLDEYTQIASICEANGIQAIELNVSCPNVKDGCLEFGKSKDSLEKLVSSVRNLYSGTLIVKLSSNVSFPDELAVTVEKAGADAISAINTVKAMSVNVNLNGFKSIKGGLSGPAIKPIALNFIHEIRNSIKIPIIGMGGIANCTDVLDFFAVGADALQIGTVNFINPNISENIAHDLENLMIKNNITSLQNLIKGVRNETN